MTVAELLRAIAAAYPAASPEALGVFKPVFQARFERREGPHLAAAWAACVGDFRPSSRQPFPIPADIEAHMPSMVRHEDDPRNRPIRQALADRVEQAKTGYAAWLDGQGRKIQQARPARVYEACVLRALELAPKRSPLILTAEEIAECEQRALSSARVAAHGRIPAAETTWRSQLEAVTASWEAGIEKGNS